MAIHVDLVLSPDEGRQLAGILKCDEGDLDEVLTPYAQAALEEYARMFIGQRVFTRGADIREYRLFLLIREAFANQIPDEQRVSDLFQTTASQSRSLIRSVMSKYQYELQDAIEGSLKAAVEEAPGRRGRLVCHRLLREHRRVAEPRHRINRWDVAANREEARNGR